MLGSSDSESEDERRVVRSAKDRATEELLSICNELRNKMHINDWQSIQTLWDKLNKQLERTQKVTGAIGTPRPYIKILVELEDFLNKTLSGTLLSIKQMLKIIEKNKRCRQDSNLRGLPQQILFDQPTW